MSVNKVVLVGRLGKDPIVQTLLDGIKITSFSVATSEMYSDKATGMRKEVTEWHHIKAKEQIAEAIGKLFKKGDQVYIEGRMRTSSWEWDNSTPYQTEVVVDNMRLLTRKSGSPY